MASRPATSFIVRKFFVIPLLVVAYVLLGGPTASAHNGITTYVYLSFYDAGIDGRLEVPAPEIGAVLGIEFGDDADEILAIAQANQDEILGYLDEHTALRSLDGEQWQIEFGEMDILDRGARSYLLIPFEVTDELDPTPRQIEVEFDAIIEANPEKDALLHIENDVRSATIANYSEALLGFSTGLTVQTVVLDTASTLEQVGAVRGAGTGAVRGGVVHILFVGAILTPVALLARGRGFDAPAPTVAAVARRGGAVLGVSGLGALASVWLTGFGVIEPSGSVAVALGALSLLAAAGWVVGCAVRPRIAGYETSVVAVLGLLQGVTYGRAFVAAGLDRSQVPLSLVGFSIGVGVAVLIVAVLAAAPMIVLRATPIAPFVLGAVALVAAAYASVWILEGVADDDWWSLWRIENPWSVLPRNVIIAMLVTLAAVGLRALFAARGRLRPIGEEGAATLDDVAEREPAVSA